METSAGQRALRVSLDSAERIAKLSVSCGKARGRGQSSKAKGRQVVIKVRDLLRDCLGIPEQSMVVKATSMPGVDLYIDPAARALFPYAIECKGVEALNIWQAIAQADAQATEVSLPAIVFFKRAKSPLYVALDASVFLSLLKPRAQGEVVRGEEVAG